MISPAKMETTGSSIDAARRLATQATGPFRAPELLARIASPDLEPLPLVSLELSICVMGHRVRVVHDLVFHNPSTQTLVDLHVRESILVEVSYTNMRSLSGGLSHWDNTQGLGPEMYHHPRLPNRGFAWRGGTPPC